jgi:aldehyde oxidoreductase
MSYLGKWTASMNSNCDANGPGNPFAVYMYGAFMVEVTVNTKASKTTVEGMTVMADVGKINNRLVVDGQIYGGVAQGIGLALSDDFEDIEKHNNMRGRVSRMPETSRTSSTSITLRMRVRTARSARLAWVNSR